MKLYNKWRETFGDSDKRSLNSEFLVKNFKNFINEQNDPEDVDLSSFDFHDELNKDFWNQEDDRLDPEIRQKLIAIADDFWSSLEVGDTEYDDITFTGSLASCFAACPIKRCAMSRFRSRSGVAIICRLATVMDLLMLIPCVGVVGGRGDRIAPAHTLNNRGHPRAAHLVLKREDFRKRIFQHKIGNQ